ncbi:hypothetical protein LNP00_06165 [Fructobacillus sp. M158]|uniref:hypothetical protein n=1 Tax=Fructobacillus parabroussonetiae TaxID=2713174 RepID=UPI00200AB3B8|nr:hypothetical protein [Fructobacillus parabroussonetiae]MCK8617936.1 hypothetical protein [Fructobacillus parabroussonetiae]
MQTFVKEFETLVVKKKNALLSSSKFVDLETQINEYAKENSLEIVNLSAQYGDSFAQSSEFARALVLFRRIEG